VAIFSLYDIETIDHKKVFTCLLSMHCIKVCEVFISKVENYLEIRRDRDFDVKKGGMAGLTGKNRRDGGIWEPYCGPSMRSSNIQNFKTTDYIKLLYGNFLVDWMCCFYKISHFENCDDPAPTDRLWNMSVLQPLFNDDCFTLSLRNYYFCIFFVKL